MAEPYLKEVITKDLDLRKIAAMVKTRIEIFPDIKEHIDFFEALPEYFNNENNLSDFCDYHNNIRDGKVKILPYDEIYANKTNLIKELLN